MLAYFRPYVPTLGRLHTAYGLAAGSCKPVFCKKQPCQVLDEEACRYPKLARPSMEAVGINVFKLAKEVGWEIHKIVEDSKPEDIPSGMLTGLLLIDKDNSG